MKVTLSLLFVVTLTLSYAAAMPIKRELNASNKAQFETHRYPFVVVTARGSCDEGYESLAAAAVRPGPNEDFKASSAHCVVGSRDATL